MKYGRAGYENVGVDVRIVEWKLVQSANAFERVTAEFDNPVYETGRVLHRMLHRGYDKQGYVINKFAESIAVYKEEFNELENHHHFSFKRGMAPKRFLT